MYASRTANSESSSRDSSRRARAHPSRNPDPKPTQLRAATPDDRLMTSLTPVWVRGGLIPLSSSMTMTNHTWQSAQELSASSASLGVPQLARESTPRSPIPPCQIKSFRSLAPFFGSGSDQIRPAQNRPSQNSPMPTKPESK